MPRSGAAGAPPTSLEPGPDNGRIGDRRLRGFVTGGQHPLFCRLPVGGGEEQILLDGNALAKPHAYFRLGDVSHSPDHSLIAYAVDTNGSELYRVNVIEAATGALLDSRIVDSSGSLEWAADSRTLLYVWLDNEHRPRRVLRHVDGLSYPEAAEALSRPEGTVKAQVHRGIALLRTMLEAEDRREPQEMTA